jgi:hypothetical protein
MSYSIVLVVYISSLALGSAELSVSGTQFTINGKPTFLLGISYYGALGASEEFIRKDLDDIQKYGFNWLRLWATWAASDNDVSAVEGNGNPREPYLSKLRWIIEECNRRGIIVDVTLSRGNGVTGTPRLQSTEALKQAASTLVMSLKPYRNWYLDMGNERNIRDERFVSTEELTEVRKLVRQLDQTRLATASFSGDIEKNELKQILDTRVDFLSPHRPRHAKSPLQTAAQTKKYLEMTKELGRVLPVQYQEPFRRGYTPKDWEPRSDDFLTDLKGAMTGGAAGWCFHNGDQKNVPQSKPGRSFNMLDKRLFEQLDAEEMAFVRQAKAALDNRSSANQ